MRSALVVSILLLLLVSQPLSALEIQPLSKVAFSFEEFQHQKVLYEYLTKDYLSSSVMSEDLIDAGKDNLDVKERAQLFLRLSDNELLYKRDYEPFTSKLPGRDNPYLVRLLDVTYKSGEHEEVMSLSKSLNMEDVARYFEGISLLRLDRLGEASLALEQIGEKDRFYPHARIALVQIDVMKQDMKGAERSLRELLDHPSVTGTGLAERVHLMLGQVLFEGELYEDSLNEFLKVPESSPFYREAVVGVAWNLIKLGDYTSAIAVLQDIRSELPYDRVDQEAKLIIGYCYLELGMTEKAVTHFQDLLKISADTDKRLKLMSGERSEREWYVTTLVDRRAGHPTSLERSYLQTLRNDPPISDLLRGVEVLHLLRRGYLEREKDITDKKAHYSNAIKGLQRRLRRVEDRIVKVKSEMRTAVREIRRREKVLASTGHANKPFFTSVEKVIYDSWQKALKKKIHRDTKRLIRLILQEWSDDELLEGCKGPQIICYIVSFLSMDDRTTENIEQMRSTVTLMESIGSDLASTEKGKKIGVEKRFSAAEGRARRKIAKYRKAIIELDRMRKEIKSSVELIDKKLESVRAEMDVYVRERFLKMRYELGDFKSDIVAGLDRTVTYVERGR